MVHRTLVLAMRGFHWCPEQALWRYSHLQLSDEQIITMPEPTWRAFMQHLDCPGCPTCGRPWAYAVAS
jgi:hypothetical protein